MMKRLLAAMLIGCPFSIFGAGPSTDMTVDFSARTAPAQEVYQANAKTFNVTLKNAGAAVNMTNYTPFLYWANSNTAAAVSTAACTVVSTTGGTFTATFTPAALNSAGTKIYGVGLTSNDVTVARQGTLVITPDPYAANVAPVTYSTNINWALINWYNLYISYTAITNAPWSVTGSVSSVAYATNSGTAAGGWPTSWPYTAITNAPWLTVTPSLPYTIITNAPWLTAVPSLPWSIITNAPTSVAGYGITNAFVYTNDSRLTDSRTPLAHTQDVSTVSGAGDLIKSNAADLRITTLYSTSGVDIVRGRSDLSGYGLTYSTNNNGIFFFDDGMVSLRDHNQKSIIVGDNVSRELYATSGVAAVDFTTTNPVMSGIGITGLTAAQVGAASNNAAGIAAAGGVTTNGGTFAGAVLSDVDYFATSPAANEIPTAEWVRSLAIQGSEWFLSANVTNGYGEKTANFVSLSATPVTAGFTNSIASPVTSSTYLAGGVATQLFGSLRSPVTFEVWCQRTGGNSSSIVPAHPEIYYVYNGTTNHLGDYDAGDQNIADSTTAGKKTWTVSFTPPTITGSVWVVGYLKSGTVSGTACGVNILGGGIWDSHMSIDAVNAGETAADVAANLTAHLVDTTDAHSAAAVGAVPINSLTFTNNTTLRDGVLNGTNGAYFTQGTNNYWILF